MQPAGAIRYLHACHSDWFGLVPQHREPREGNSMRSLWMLVNVWMKEMDFIFKLQITQEVMPLFVCLLAGLHKKDQRKTPINIGSRISFSTSITLSFSNV